MRTLLILLAVAAGVGTIFLLLAVPADSQPMTSEEAMRIKVGERGFRHEHICVGKEDPPKPRIEDGTPPECMFYYNEKTDTFFRLHFKVISPGKNLEKFEAYREYKRKQDSR